MTPHANFAIAFAVRESVLQSLIRIRYHVGKIRHWYPINTPSIEAYLFLDMPEVHCSTANNNQIMLRQRAWGALSLSLLGQMPETWQVLLDLNISAPVRFSLLQSNQGNLPITSLLTNLDATNATLGTFEIRVLESEAFPPPISQHIESDAFRTTLQMMIRNYLAELELIPRLNVSALLGALGPVVGMEAASQILDQVIVIGCDVNQYTTSDNTSITTYGDPNLLTDISEGRDIAIWTNPVAVPIVVEEWKHRITQAAGQQGVWFDPPLTFAPEEGHIHLSAGAHNPDGSATISLNAKPRIGPLPKPPERWELTDFYEEQYDFGWPESRPAVLWYELKDIKVETDRPWYVHLLDAVGLFFTLGAVHKTRAERYLYVTVREFPEWADTIAGLAGSGRGIMNVFQWRKAHPIADKGNPY